MAHDDNDQERSDDPQDDPAGELVPLRPAPTATPELWLYVHGEAFRVGYEALALDETGHPWVPKADRRRKAGFRWVSAYPSAAQHRCGATRSQIGAA